MKLPTMPRLALCAAVLCLAGPLAHATCLPIARTVYVGSGSQCDYDNIQDAINAATCPETIVINGDPAVLAYTLQHLVIIGKSLTLSGSTTGCGMVVGGTSAVDDAPPPQITLDARNAQGGGANNHPVFTIAGDSRITLRNLKITGADYSGGEGGGILFDATGSLTLGNVTVTDNSAGSGGGIYFNGGGDADHVSDLTLDENTLIIGNTADTGYGGGIRVEGQARLIAIKPQTGIFSNHAPSGYGGGIEVTAPARAYFGSPGYGGSGVIEWNSAYIGGGMAMLGGPNQTTCAQFFTTDPAHPIEISNNSAASRGGGIYVVGSTNPVGTNLEMTDFIMQGNVAADGSAIYAENPDATVSLSHSGIIPVTSPCIGSDQDAVTVQQLSKACAKGLTCSDMSGNGARLANGDPSTGAILTLINYGAVHGHGLQLRNNEASNLIRIIGGKYASALDNLLLADNTVDQPLLALQNNPAGLYISSATIAGNTIAHGAVVHAVQEFGLSNSIIDQPGIESLDYTGELSKVFVNYLLSNDASTLPGGTTREGEPDFVDAAHGNYHLLPSSLGVDYAPSGSEIADLDGRNREVDLLQVDNWYGPRDLGAYERQSAFACDDNADALFCDGFETQP
jgi:predicted outer membrane repeat protein